MIQDWARARMAGLLAVVMAASTVVPGVSAAAAPGAVPLAGEAGTTSVTLVTGDRVTLDGVHGVRVRAAEGREHVGFSSSKDVRGDVHVVPTDVAPLVAAGRLDPRLFNVSELARIGYDDAKRTDLPLIVDFPGATPRVAGARVDRELLGMGAVAVRAEKNATFWSGAAASATKIWLDGPVWASLDQSVPQIGAPDAWAAGHTGAGTTVAVLDSGVDATHPDLDDAVVESRDFTGSESGADDRLGHGTHLASIITGDGERHQGVAPDAKLLNGKVLDDSGGGRESGIIAGMEWAVNAGADVVNMSLGSSMPSNGADPLSQAVNRLTAETGALFVVSAGNSGPHSQSIGAPGAADAALTVGAVDRDDELAEFSSRGPRWEDDAIKPDITAPGVGIVAAKATHGLIGTPAGDGYVALSGTSMAAPHVAGAAAILAGRHPDWAAAQLKSRLMGTAKPNARLSIYEQGAGRVDLAAAVDATVSASPASVNAGVARWPHGDDQPIVNTIGYTNYGTEPVTLNVTPELRGPDGNPAPEGMFTISPSQVTIPAGGQAQVTLTADTTLAAPDGGYHGALTATAGDLVVRTPVGLTKELESYDVTVKFRDHDGAPTDQYFYRFVDVSQPKAYLPFDPSGTVVVRLPKGRYYFQASVTTGGSAPGSYLITSEVEPAYTVTGDAELVVDAREGKPVNVRVDQRNAHELNGTLQFALQTEWGETGLTRFIPNAVGFDGQLVTPSSTSAGENFQFTVNTELAEPDGTGGYHGSPYLYHIRWTEPGRVPETLDRRFTNRQLARVNSEHAAGTPGLIGMRNGLVTGMLPFSLTEYYTPAVPWYDSFFEVTDPDQPARDYTLSTTDGRVYKRGQVATERWNFGVFGPAFPTRDSNPGIPARRLGDDLLVIVPLFTDQASTREGTSSGVTGTTELLCDGTPVGESELAGFGLFLGLPAEDSV